MTPERHQQIGQLYHAALELAPTERAAFLAQACAGDKSLRSEVESLLAVQAEADNFFAAPAMEIAAKSLAAEQAQVTRAERLGHYRIIAPLGAGGMGEVYLAQDQKLGRKLALKLLPAAFTASPDRLRRFEQEARAASALNHPNIITIYEVGEIEGTHYIATEYVEGQTLRQQLTSERLSVLNALEIVLQVTSALAAAHEAGIIHRDIKPENVMQRPDGLVKVLDFGLAKLTEQSSRSQDTKTPTALKFESDSRAVLGTASYMSPEQARGLKVDSRTDIFSLGIVLYELVAGRAPFSGVNAIDMMGAILNQEPAPLCQHASATPAELQRIVSKALRKEREERYQTVKDLLLDLKSLKRELELEAQSARSGQRKPGAESSEVSTGETAVATTSLAQAAQTGEAGAAHRTSSAEYLFSQARRHPRGALIVLAMLLLVGAGIVFGLWQLIARQQRPISFQTMSPTRLTATGRADRPAISPDGKYVVYVLGEGLGGQQSLWLRQVATGSDQQIVPPAEVQYLALTFSPDGNYVYYLRREGTVSFDLPTLYRSPSLGGGAATKLIEGVGRFLLSPDGKRLVVMRGGPNQAESALVVVNVDGTGEQQLTTSKSPAYFSPLAWSPDGRTIACADYPTPTLAAKIIAVEVADGARTPISSLDWVRLTPHAAWLPDGSGLLFTSSGQQGADSSPQIWYLSYPGGEARMLTDDLASYEGVSLTADARALVTTRTEQAYNLWIMPAEDASRARPLTTGKQSFSGVAWTTDGKLVYSSDESGGLNNKLNIWLMEPDGSASRRLTAAEGDYRGVIVSPDDRYLLFLSNRSGQGAIWRMDFDGSNLKQLTAGLTAGAQCSPDGRWVIYQTNREDGGLWKVPIDGGEPVRITDQYTWFATISPDGNQIATNYRTQLREQYRIAVMPIEGGPPTKVFDTPGDRSRRIRWTPDGRALTYTETRAGVTNLWNQPLAGGPPTRLTDFKDSQIGSFAWSRDGRQLAFARGAVTRDVVLLRLDKSR